MKLQPKHFYMALPVLLLTMSGSIQLTAAVIASQGNGAEIERDYYERALHWDDYQELVAASHRLGWTVEILPDEIGTLGAPIGVTFALRDRDGQPVSGASGVVSAFQNGHVDEMFTLELVEAARGLFRASFNPRRTGRWVWRMRFARGEDVFVAEQRAELHASEEGLR